MRLRILLALSLLWSGGAVAIVPVGSVVLYSDGTVEKLLSREGDRLRWEDDRKRQYVRSTNPILPAVEKRNFLQSSGYQQQVAAGVPGAIHTLPQGTPVEFTVVRTALNGNSSRRHWECVFLGEVQQLALGKQRRLENYSCERFKVHRKFHNRWFREKRDFAYSPDLGLVVDLSRETRTKRSRKKLVAVYPPDKVNYPVLSRAVGKLRRAR
jgi:hypothetical protein